MKKVRQLTREGELIKEFDSCKEASVTLNIQKSDISKCCNYHVNTAGGFRFEFING